MVIRYDDSQIKLCPTDPTKQGAESRIQHTQKTQIQNIYKHFPRMKYTNGLNCIYSPIVESCLSILHNIRDSYNFIVFKNMFVNKTLSISNLQTLGDSKLFLIIQLNFVITTSVYATPRI
jgi:hypothetical protein